MDEANWLLMVKTDLISNDYSQSVTIPGDKSIDVNIYTVSSLVSAGKHSFEVVVSCDNGLEVERSITVFVVDAEPIVIKEGDSIELEGDAFTAYTVMIADASTARIEGGRIYGMSSGDTFIILKDGDRVVAYVPVYVTVEAAAVAVTQI